MVSVTRFLCEPASTKVTKFITDPMQKLTLTIERRKDGTTRRILSNFNPLNTAILRVFDVIQGVETM